MAFQPVSLAESHDVSSFCCGGEESLDDFLKNEALTAVKRGLSRTYVWLNDNKVVAYYTVIAQTISPSNVPKSVRRGISGGIPGFTIGKLALDQTLRGKELGRDLLVDALRTIVAAADLVGGRVITVTAHGPVVRSEYRRFKQYGKALIDPQRTVPQNFDWDRYSSAQEFLLRIWNAYGAAEAWALRERTHREPPWREAFDAGRNRVITTDAMHRYFSGQELAQA